MQASGYRLIPLRARGGLVVAETKVDAEDFERFNDRRWYLDGRGYVRRTTSQNGRRRALLLHREILGLTDPRIKADHINRDRLDNRRANLRTVTDAGNAQNRATRFANNTSGYKGVSWDKRVQKWYAHGRLNGRMYALGRYADIEEAARVAAEWRALHHPYSEEARNAS